jgi:chromosome segregation ATPase
MDPRASETAISAVAALQSRLVALEKENDVLVRERQSLRQRCEFLSSLRADKMSCMNELTDTSQVISKGQFLAVQDLGDARDEQEYLESDVARLEDRIRMAQTEIKSRRRGSQRVTSDLKHILASISHYESLLSDVLQHALHLTAKDAARNSASDVAPGVLPVSLSELLRTLRGFPKQFACMGVETKREVVKGVAHACAAVTELNAKIKALELERQESPNQRAFDSDIDLLSKHL